MRACVCSYTHACSELTANSSWAECVSEKPQNKRHASHLFSGERGSVVSMYKLPPATARTIYRATPLQEIETSAALVCMYLMHII